MQRVRGVLQRSGEVVADEPDLDWSKLHMFGNLSVTKKAMLLCCDLHCGCAVACPHFEFEKARREQSIFIISIHHQHKVD